MHALRIIWKRTTAQGFFAGGKLGADAQAERALGGAVSDA